MDELPVTHPKIDQSIETSLGRHPHIACVGGKVYVCVGHTFRTVVGLTKNGDTAGNLHSGLFRTDSSADAYADCREACGVSTLPNCLRVKK